MPQNQNTTSQIQTSLLGIARIHFAYVLIYAGWIVVADGTHLIVPELVLQNWTMAAILFAGTAIVWNAARKKVSSNLYYRALVYLLILLDIATATFNIYTQRGMASRAVMLYTIPIAVAAALLSRAAIFTTASLAAATYVVAAVRYFVVNFNEGYKAELYAEVGLYCAMFFVLAAILSVLTRNQNTKSNQNS